MLDLQGVSFGQNTSQSRLPQRACIQYTLQIAVVADDLDNRLPCLMLVSNICGKGGYIMLAFSMFEAKR